jgi:hypothetical protein
MTIFRFGQPHDGVIQTAFITQDIEKSMLQMSAELNIGPWFHFENFPLENLHYKGEPADFEVTIALANSGHMQFELIQQLDNKPSVYKDICALRGYGFHHYAVGTLDYEGTCEKYRKAGYKKVLSCVADLGARAAYFETTSAVFGMIEVIEVIDAVEDLWEMVRAPSVNWDGNTPIRRVK